MLNKLPNRAKDLTGLVFGRLTVESFSHQSKNGALYWNCICSCGVKVARRRDTLVDGNISCGCASRGPWAQSGRWEENMARYGAKRVNDLPEYQVWINMVSRCRSKNHPAAKRYSDLGITLCDEWSYFDRFFEDMGPRPSANHWIKRVNPAQGFNPQNCVWKIKESHRKDQLNSVYIDTPIGRMNAADAAKRFGVPATTIRSRVKRGWPHSRLLEKS